MRMGQNQDGVSSGVSKVYAEGTEMTSGRDRRILLICAMPSELGHALARIEGVEAGRIGLWTCYSGSLNGKPVTAVATGIGLINAAAAMSVLLAREQAAVVLNYGCAGAHRRDILPGDVVIGTGIAAYGSLIVLPGGDESYAGFRYDLDGEVVVAEELLPDSELLRLASESASGWTPAPWPAMTLADRDPIVHQGVIGSADCWTKHPARIDLLHERHRSLCEEMEAAALAQVCALYRVPFLAIKDISNNEFMQTTDETEWDQIQSEVGARAFALVERLVARLHIDA